MSQLATFSTQVAPPNLQFRMWLCSLRHYFGDVRASAPRRNGFNASMESISDGEVVVTRMQVDAQNLEHCESTAPAAHTGFIHAVFPLTGRFHIEQGGRSTVLAPDDWGIYDLSKSFRSVVNRPVEILVLAAPRPLMVDPHFELDHYAAQRLSARSGGARVVRTFLTSLLEEHSVLRPALRRDFAAVALHLARQTMMDIAFGNRTRSARPPLRARIESYVERHLRDPGLSIGQVAGACGCSKSYVHRVFSSPGCSLSRYILQSRLRGCAADLANPAMQHRSITDIAVSWGFNSSSSFSRAFRRQFRTPPRLFRCSRPV